MKRYVFGILALLIIGLLVGALGHHKKSAPVVVATKGSYVALGDSVAAGIGLTGDSDSSACDRTNQSYPNLVATALHYKLTNLACSGATLPAGILGSQDVNDLMEKPQLNALFGQPVPQLITISIGANDADWTGLIAKCYTAACGSAADTASVQAKLATVSTNLSSVLSQMQTHYGDHLPLIVVTGYHQVFPANSTTCSDLTGIDASELAWGRQQQASINSTIQATVAKFSFARYAAINFSGHELCTADSWVQGLADSEPYHPTAAGQTEFAKQVEAAVRS